jgi:YVTN family beta-propeller protein
VNPRHLRLTRTFAIVATIAIIGAFAVTRGTSSPKKRAAPGGTTTSSSGKGTTSTKGSGPPVPTIRTYSEHALTTLSAPLEDPAAAAFGTGVRLAGGLDAADTSTANVVAATDQGSQVVGQLPSARHDAAGAGLGDSLYVFGGGDSVGQLDSIVRVDSSGVSTTIGTLPASSSDSTAAVVDGTAYIAGGYTGTQWLDTIVAFHPGSPATVVAHLPTAVRYAAVAAVGGVVVIAGGSTTSTRATTPIYTFVPKTGAVAKLGDLPNALTHASAAASGNEIVVVGGQDTNRDSVSSIVAIDPVSKDVRVAGQLLAPRSDAALVASGNGLLLLGGHNASGTLSGVSKIVATTQPVTTTSTGPTNVYAHDSAGALSAVARTARQLVYVPNSESDTVDVIDQHTMKIVGHFAVGGLPQHVTPSWDLRTLYVDNDHGNSLTPIDPNTGLPRGPAIPVTDPYNLYFTPSGRYAIVVAEAMSRLDFRDPKTMNLVTSLPVPCRGIDHMDFTADGTLALASCEFSGEMVVIDVVHQRVVQRIPIPRPSARPQDVKLSPDGSVFYVADMDNAGAWEIDAHSFAVLGLLPTGSGAHGLYPSRDAKHLYVTNRGAGTISVVDFATRAVVATWSIPGGSPDMGGVSADGRVLWLSGRYNAEVYAISTSDGQLLARIPVGRGPHGLCVWPQPGRYSLGHTGVMR